MYNNGTEMHTAEHCTPTTSGSLLPGILFCPGDFSATLPADYIITAVGGDK